MELLKEVFHFLRSRFSATAAAQPSSYTTVVVVGAGILGRVVC